MPSPSRLILIDSRDEGLNDTRVTRGMENNPPPISPYPSAVCAALPALAALLPQGECAAALLDADVPALAVEAMETHAR